MAEKKIARKRRILIICGWAAMVVFGVREALVHHGPVRFGTLLGLATALMCLGWEVTALLQDPDE
jgi:hypothetical protein